MDIVFLCPWENVASNIEYRNTSYKTHKLLPKALSVRINLRK